jgi:hypothetical protein
VSTYKYGLLPITQNALLIYGTELRKLNFKKHSINVVYFIVDQVKYHVFEGIVINEEEKRRIVEDLGPTKKVRQIERFKSCIYRLYRHCYINDCSRS